VTSKEHKETPIIASIAIIIITKKRNKRWNYDQNTLLYFIIDHPGFGISRGQTRGYQTKRNYCFNHIIGLSKRECM